MKEIEQLYKEYKQDVYRYLFSLTKDPTMTEDLLSDTFVQAISSLHTFKGKSSVKTWLFSIARNMWLSKLRREKNMTEYADFLGIYVSENLAEKLVEKEAINFILKLLAEKDERTQQIVRMRASGYSYFEISKELGVSESTARVIDFRTKKWLREQLRKEELY